MNIKSNRFASVISAVAIMACACVFGYEYDVRRPSDVLKPTFKVEDTVPGKWTFQLDDALAKAKAAGKYTLLLNTASWWCPHCELFEENVLTSKAWQDFVDRNGFYLAMLDFPYRLAVPEDQQWKSWRPDLGDGWGFKCWMMCEDYLAEIGYTKEQGLAFIMDNYRIQQQLGAEVNAGMITITDPLTGEEFTYGKVGYPSIIVFGPDGEELGRQTFQSWLRQEGITAEAMQEEAIETINRLIVGDCTICGESLGGAVPTDAAQTYDGWVSDDDGVVGTLEVKTGKQSKNGLVKVTCSITLKGRKLSLGNVNAEDLSQSVRFEKKGAVVELRLGEVGLIGTLTYEGESYGLTGGRNVFKAKDDAAKERKADYQTGTWGIALKEADSVEPSEFARGYGALSVQLQQGGKVKVSGTLSDGTKVNVSSRMIMGDCGSYCVPIRSNLYSKRGGFGFVLWFRDGKLYCSSDVSSWVSAGKHEFTSDYSLVFTSAAGAGTVSGELDFVIDGLTEDTLIQGLPLAGDPSLDTVTVSGKRWKGTEETSFNANLNTKTSLLTGTMTFVVDKGNGRTRNVRGNFTGVVIGGSAYGSVVVRNVGAWPVKIMVCGSCGD